ncbi:MAG: hypothetical protein K2X87_32740, partial [Gemmataceae bacterium]|nr:hypothetical protein [Gemmataceae bacterium]
MSEPYPAAVPVRGATIPAPPEPGGPGPAADEAAVVHILRILHRVRDAGTLAPIDRAFVLAARAMFAELGNVCDALLSRPPEPAGPPRRPALPVIGGEGPTPAP